MTTGRKIKWLAWEKYAGRILATSASYDGIVRMARKAHTACVAKSNHLPEWIGRNWHKGDILPLR